jgi:hypothetical protein
MRINKVCEWSFFAIKSAFCQANFTPGQVLLAVILVKTDHSGISGAIPATLRWGAPIDIMLEKMGVPVYFLLLLIIGRRLQR